MMGAYMLIIAILTKTNPPSDTPKISSTGIASVAMIYLEASKYQLLSDSRYPAANT